MNTSTKSTITGRYAQLAADLRAAADAARLVDLNDDGGTCNFDGLELTLPRWQEASIKAAAESAGLRAFKRTLWGSVSYVFSVPEYRQGIARTRQAETMRDVMKARGYDASVYYQMD